MAPAIVTSRQMAERAHISEKVFEESSVEKDRISEVGLYRKRSVMTFNVDSLDCFFIQSDDNR